jgi:hypothetical protein
MAESVITFPRCVDTHAATQQAAVTSWQPGVYGVLQHNRGRGGAGLRCVPVSFRFIELGR